MDDRRQNRNRKQGGSFSVLWGILIYLLFIVITTMGGSGGSHAVFNTVMVLIVAAASIAIAVTKSMTSMEEKKEGEKNPFFPIQPLIKRKAKQPSSTQPDPARPQAAPVRVYNDRIREEDAARDRQRRLKQLEEFYKNGFVDREEYRVLRQRYEQEGR